MMLLACVFILVLPLNLLGQLTKQTLPGKCATDLDCALMGDCISGNCVCDEGYTGPNCQYFDLIPAKNPDIEGFVNPAYPSWGGKTIFVNGTYHFISTYLRETCDIATYNTNSAFLRAVADHPMGPFTYVEEVMPPFHHGAQVERTPQGGYVIFGDGRDMPESTVRKNCRGGLVKWLRDLAEAPPKNLYPYGNSPNDVHIAATSDSITGPWTQNFLPDLQTDVSKPRLWSCNKTNLAPLILKNNTVIMGFRSKPCVGNIEITSQNIGIAVSHNGVKGPYEIRKERLAALDGNEDGFMYQNKRGFLMVMHGKAVCGKGQAEINSCGSIGYSADSYTWYLSPFPVYGGEVKFDPSLNKKPEILFSRQRPKILMSNEGVPLVLYNGGQRDGHAFVRGFAFAFNVKEMRNFQKPPVCPPKNFQNMCTTFERRHHVYNRTELGCKMFENTLGCRWCGQKNACMFGEDERICEASSVETFFAHC